MFSTNAAPTVYIDVDSTLVYTQSEAPAMKNQHMIFVRNRAFVVHWPHVECIRDFKARGHNVIVWSQGGAEWAKDVVDALGIAALVDACLSKPLWYFDDKDSSEWLKPHMRTYLNP